MIVVMDHLCNPDYNLTQISAIQKLEVKLVMTTPTPFGVQIHTVGVRIGLFYKEFADQYVRFYNMEQISQLINEYSFVISDFEVFLFHDNQLVVCKKS